MTDAASEPDPRAGDIRLTLDRILASPTFSKSAQLSSFLRYVVEETLAGRGGGIKAYTIGVDALGRDAGFDPQSDAIVRVEAARLRRALETYFAGVGRDDPIVVELPTGRYVPVFRSNGVRRRAGRRFAELKTRYWLALQQNYRLILLIAVIAGLVSVTLDLTGMLLSEKVWPWLQHAGQSQAPASTGAIPR
ncbi:MAG TPA: hypothetical protein VG986_04455 [Pseudolabrys sp.]|nr:hypothetical protein [Pseudolabrys sp.]